MSASFFLRVLVKFKEGVPAISDSHTPREWVEGQIGSHVEIPASLRVRTLVRNPEEIGRLREIALSRDPDYWFRESRINLLFYAALDCGDLAGAQFLARSFRALESVQTAYLQVGAGSAGASVPDSYERIRQGYLDRADKGGVDARYAWRFPGGNGLGMRLVDIERGWLLNHRDLNDARITLISGKNVPEEENHGTKTLGVISAMNNRAGKIGIAHGIASLRVASIRQEESLDSTVEAILSAVSELRFGDVLLVEVHLDDGVSGFQPVEVEEAVFDAIRFATALGIVVIEPASNGGGGDDSPLKGNLDILPALDRNHEGFRESGAIVVGAATSAFPHEQLDFSSFGNRVDCYAWGEDIGTTARYAHLAPEIAERLRRFAWGGRLIGQNSFFEVLPLPDPNLIDLPGLFSGTSGASAILAGVALSVQGMAQAHLGFRFSPWQLRLILSDPANGKAARPGDRIGVMPDLRKIIQNVLRIHRPRNPWAGVDDTLTAPSATGDGSPSPGATDRKHRLYLLPFSIRIPAGRRVTRLEVFALLPRRASVWLEMPPEIADLRSIWGDPWIKDEEKMHPANLFIPVNPHGKSYFREVRTNAANETVHELRLLVWIPGMRQQRRFQIEVRQLSKELGAGQPYWIGQETGRVVWPLLHGGGRPLRPRRVSV